MTSWRAAGHGSLLIAVWRVKTVAEATGHGLLERERGFGSRGAVGSLTAASPTRDRVVSNQRRGAGLGRRRLVLAVAVVAAAVVL